MMKPITDYEDYRLFLLDFYNAKKKHQRGWSLGAWTRSLGLKSVSSLSMILAGKRHPSTKLTSTLSQYFQLNHRDEKYLQTLVRMQKKASLPNMTLMLTAEEDLLPAKLDSPLATDVSGELQELLMQKLTHTLRELVEVKTFQSNPEWIAKKLRKSFSPAEIERHLEQLISRNLLKSEGKVLSAVPASLKGKKPSPNRLDQFHREILEETLEALPNLEESQRAFHVSFLNIRKDKIRLAMKLLREFQSNFNALVEEKPGDEVYQLSMQFIPLTRTED